MNNDALQHQRQHIRRTMRLRRRSLTPLHQKQAAKKVARRLVSLLNRQKISRRSLKPIKIGVYAATASELDLKPFVIACKYMFKSVQLFYPVVEKNKALRFALRHPRGFARRNCYNIREPQKYPSSPMKSLDVVLLPLVAATPNGTRLGMGGGYYDRSINQLKATGLKPQIIGVAYDFQIIDHIPTAPWDHSLNWLVCPAKSIRCT